MIDLTKDRIIDYITKNGQASGQELFEYLGTITSRAVRKQLKNLLDMGVLEKTGKPPKVYYAKAKKKEPLTDKVIPKELRRIIDKRYLFISPTGQSIAGWEGFVTWCIKTNQDPVKTAKEFINTLKKYDQFRKDNLIDGMAKMKQTFGEVFVDKLFYLDFYSIERFGKTKLGQMLLYAKQSQNRNLISQLIREIRPQILQVIKEYKIDGILFIPPTVKREVQFMKELERQLSLPITSLSVTKIKTDIAVPQKTLTKIEDRIENAKLTIVVDENKIYKNILLIDDAVGSGATINETSHQIKKRELTSGSVIGLAITGSYKGFDVISEV